MRTLRIDRNSVGRVGNRRVRKPATLWRAEGRGIRAPRVRLSLSPTSRPDNDSQTVRDISIYCVAMAQRLLAFALACVFGAVPVAGEICDVTCAEHAGHTLDGHRVVSHHHHIEATSATTHHHAPSSEAISTQPLSMRMGPSHNCVEPDAVVSESRHVVRGPMLDGRSGVVNITRAIASVHRVATDRQHGPPTPTRSTSQLRV
jgi:hypothetical protein